MARFPSSRSRQSLSLRRIPVPIGRRRFLRLLGGTAAAAGLFPLLRGMPGAAAQPPDLVKVLIEDLRLGPTSLAAGTLAEATATPQGIKPAPGRRQGEYLSPVLVGQRRFTHLGLHWQADLPEALSLSVRWTEDGAAWSDWEAVTLEPHVPPGSSETFGALVRTGSATRAQFRARFAGGGPQLKEVTATLLNVNDGPSITTSSLAETAEQPTTAGQVFTREAWGADESLRFDAGGAEIWPRMYVPVKKAVVHHTATTNDYTEAQAIEEVKAIYTYHAVTLGWGGIGYNIIIDKFGNVYEGRYGRDDPDAGSRETFSPGVVAGHALSHNYGTSGIALLGTFTQAGEGGKPGGSPTPEAQNALLDVLAWECNRNDLEPDAVSDFLLFDDTWNRGLENICGHRDSNATICPGGYVYDLLPSLRDAVSSHSDLQGRGDVAVEFVPPSSDTISLSNVESVQFSWGPDGGSFLYLLEGWDRIGQGEDIDYLSGYDPDAHASWAQTELTAATFGELFDAFSTLAAPAGGHYTFHVLAMDSQGLLSYQRDHTLLVTDDGGGGDDSEPVVSIDSPAEGATISGTETVQVDATDAEDATGTLAVEVRIDGGAWQAAGYNSGSGFYELSWDTTPLSDGAHTVEARATDSGGNTTTTQPVSVTVDNSSSEGIILSATGYKVRGLQKADLEWSGATSTNVDIYRDGLLIATTANDGFYTDNIDQRGGGSYTYMVCEAGTAICSNEVVVSF